MEYKNIDLLSCIFILKHTEIIKTLKHIRVYSPVYRKWWIIKTLKHVRVYSPIYRKWWIIKTLTTYRDYKKIIKILEHIHLFIENDGL